MDTATESHILDEAVYLIYFITGGDSSSMGMIITIEEPSSMEVMVIDKPSIAGIRADIEEPSIFDLTANQEPAITGMVTAISRKKEEFTTEVWA